MKKISKSWAAYGFEFLCIFIAVVSAFALNNWNDNRRAAVSESKILMGISAGLVKDLEDIKGNIKGHEFGVENCKYFRALINGEEVATDSLMLKYLALTRDMISIQNVAGYETLKSKGLEILSDDSLRHKIISLYEYDYAILRKLEETYAEMELHASYFKQVNDIIAPNFIFDTSNRIVGITQPPDISPEQKKIMLIILLKIEYNRRFILHYYSEVEKKIAEVQGLINSKLE